MTSPKLVTADGGDKKKPDHFYVYAREGEKSRNGYEKEYTLPNGRKVFHTPASVMETHSRVDMTDEKVNARREDYWSVVYRNDSQITLARRYAPHTTLKFDEEPPKIKKRRSAQNPCGFNGCRRAARLCEALRQHYWEPVPPDSGGKEGGVMTDITTPAASSGGPVGGMPPIVINVPTPPTGLTFEQQMQLGEARAARLAAEHQEAADAARTEREAREARWEHLRALREEKSEAREKDEARRAEGKRKEDRRRNRVLFGVFGLLVVLGTGLAVAGMLWGSRDSREAVPVVSTTTSTLPPVSVGGPMCTFGCVPVLPCPVSCENMTTTTTVAPCPASCVSTTTVPLTTTTTRPRPTTTTVPVTTTSTTVSPTTSTTVSSITTTSSSTTIPGGCDGDGCPTGTTIPGGCDNDGCPTDD